MKSNKLKLSFAKISWQIDKNSYHLKALKIINFQY